MSMSFRNLGVLPTCVHSVEAYFRYHLTDFQSQLTALNCGHVALTQTKFMYQHPTVNTVHTAIPVGLEQHPQ